MTLDEFVVSANNHGERGAPFFFLIDFELNRPVIIKLDEAANHDILYDIGSKTNYQTEAPVLRQPELHVYPKPFADYEKAFEFVMENILAGNSYLLNLTTPTRIASNLSLLNLFYQARAPYKLYFKDLFVVFSPECFVRTKEEHIYSYPMKGTIDAELPNAREQLLENEKEKWEHNTIIDLIRNDLAIIAKNISVTKLRFITEIHTNKTNLLQLSSEIRGELPNNWQKNVGDILIKLLPAGSISGAPKQKTVELIKEVEKINRDYFTGVFGVFDGKNIDSAVNIRFIEQSGENGLQFRSGGGVTANSEPHNEYNEMLNKVYVPVG